MLRQAGVASGSLIQSVNGVPTPNLAAFQAAFSTLEDGALVPIRVRHVTNRHQSALTMLRVDRTWFPALRVDRLEVSTLKHLNKDREDEASTASSSSSSSSSFTQLSMSAYEGRQGDWEATELPFTPSSSSSAVATAPASPSANSVSAAAAAAGSMSPHGFDFAAAAAAGKAAASAGSSSGRHGAAKKNGATNGGKRTTRFPPGANDAERAVAQSLVQVLGNRTLSRTRQ